MREVVDLDITFSGILFRMLNMEEKVIECCIFRKNSQNVDLI